MNLGVVIKIKRKKAIIVTETGEFKAVNARNGMFLDKRFYLISKMLLKITEMALVLHILQL